MEGLFSSVLLPDINIVLSDPDKSSSARILARERKRGDEAGGDDGVLWDEESISLLLDRFENSVNNSDELSELVVDGTDLLETILLLFGSASLLSLSIIGLVLLVLSISPPINCC